MSMWAIIGWSAAGAVAMAFLGFVVTLIVLGLIDVLRLKASTFNDEAA